MPLLVVGSASAACAGSDVGAVESREGSALRAHWSLVVHESDTLYIGQPLGLTIDPDDGSFYISDGFASRVVRVDRGGNPIAVYGRKGRGPGEFVDVGASFVWNGRIMASDGQRRLLLGFDRRTGEFVESHQVDGILKTAKADPNGVWLGLLNTSLQTGAARWSPDGATRHFAELPPAYRESQPLAGIYNAVLLDRWADSLAVGFQASNDIVLYSDGDGPADTLSIPVLRRRGVPADVVARFETVDFPEMFRTASFLFGLGRLTDGSIAAIHFDQEIEGRAISSVPYLSVSSTDRRTWCADTELPISRDAQPQTIFRGDTLFVLDQHLVDTGAETRITAYGIDTSACRWTPDPTRTR